MFLRDDINSVVIFRSNDINNFKKLSRVLILAVVNYVGFSIGVGCKIISITYCNINCMSE